MSKPTTSQWRSAEHVLLQFEDAWQQHGAASISEFLPQHNSPQRSYLLTELIKIDLEHRWARGDQARVEGYLAEFPELGGVDSIPVDLIASEFSVRHEHDEAPVRAELEQRFPKRVDELARLLPAATTGMTETSLRCADSSISTTNADCRSVPSRLGRYEPRTELGRGAFAVVYRAWDPRLHRDVAIKVPRAELIEIDELRERMLREARAAASLQHPTIVPTYEVVEEDSLYIVSEFIDGETLDQRIKRALPSFDEAAGWVAQIARGLHYAHQSGIVHRDIKPANILLDRDDKPMIADFGLAQQADAAETLTQHGDIIGTPAFMSPEQSRGHSHAVDARSDVYSVGVVLYQLLSGRLPFEGGAGSVLTRIQQEAARPLRRVRPDVPRDLETVCMRCLEKDPADRYASAQDMADDLEHHLAGEPINARPVGLVERAWKWSKRHPALATTAWLLLVAVGFLGGTGLQLRRIQTERDRAIVAEARAKSAETEKTKLLADSYQRAGSLAMQRGQFRDAIGLFEQSIAAGYEDRVALRLKQVESHFVLREFETCESLLQGLDDYALTDGKQGLLMMWQAEMLLRSSAVASDAAELYRKALTLQIPEADRAYVEGMTTASSLQAVLRFEDSLAANPFHHRARTLLVNLLVSLGRLDEAGFQARVGQQLFPDDPHFHLMEGFVLAVRGDLATANTFLQKLPSSDRDKQAWKRTYGLMNDLVTLTTDTRALNPAVGSQIVQATLAEREALATVAEFGLRFPLPLADRLAELSKLLATGVDQTNHPAKPIVSKLAMQHPEGMLLVWLGEFQIADDELQAARDTFLQAIETPSLLRNHQRAARSGIIATATALGLVRQIDREENLRHVVHAIGDLDPEQEYPLGYCKLFTKVFLMSGDAERCRIWLDKWAEHDGSDDYNVLWHRIELEAMSQRMLHMLKVCEQVLKDHPDDEHSLRMRDEALRSIRNATEAASAPSAR